MPPLVLTKRRFHAGTNKFGFITAKVAVDPYHEFIDRVQSDNSRQAVIGTA